MLFVDVEPYCRHHKHCWLCSYCHNLTQARPQYSLNALVIASCAMEFGETFPPYWPQSKQNAHDYDSRCMHRKNAVVGLYVYLSVTLTSRRQLKARRATGEIIKSEERENVIETVTNYYLSVDLVCQFVTCLMSIL